MNLDQQLATLSPAQRALFELRLIQKKPAFTPARQCSPRKLNRSSAPLSFYQQGLWVLHQLSPSDPTYHVPTAARLRGELNFGSLKKSLAAIVARHEALRSVFKTVEGEPSQIVQQDFRLDLPLVDLSEVVESDREAKALSILKAELAKPFDLSQGPLIRAVLVRLAAHDHILLVVMHHIVTDGWSIGIFHRELAELYSSFANGRSSTLRNLPIQYSDYAVWQRQMLEERFASLLSYWKQQFRSMPSPLELPADHARNTGQAQRLSRAAYHTLKLSPKLTKQLKQLCQKENVTLFMTLLAAFKTLLHRYTGEDDIVVGTPIAGRQIEQTADLVGLFINTLALRTDFSGDMTFRELLARVKQTALGAYVHQDLPFDRLVKELQPDRSLAHNPLFQVMFVLQSEEIEALQLSGMSAEHIQVDNPCAKFDLTLDVVEKNGQLVCRFESNADLFESETIERLMEHFLNLLEGIVANPEQRISQLPMLSERERQKLLVDWNNTRTDYPSDKSIQELFEVEAEKSPAAVALLCEDRQLTYAELNSRANRLGHYLRKCGVGPDTRVGLCINRSPEMIVALLGILKAGGAYVPLDPGYPTARLEFMLRDAKAPLLLTQESLLPSLPEQTAKVICLDRIDDELAQQSEHNVEIMTLPDDLAYVMYTSGSTGTPKGVAVTHRNVVRLVKNSNYASFSADEVFLQSSTVSFDASTFEIWGSLLNGARLGLLPPGTPSLKDLGDALKRYQVTTLWLTAGLFHLMVDDRLEDLRGVRQLLAGGDVLSVPHVQKVFKELKGCRLINGYGPTENTTFTCCFPLTDLTKVNGSVPIGYPISNTSVYVLDRYMNPAPIGVPGELYVGGDGLARGYLDRPELNAERFVRNPFGNGHSSRLYKTGDLVRYRAGGEIEFIGRIDSQVKVRGFRIELSEIELALAKHPHIRDAAVIACRDNGDKHLVAYLVPDKPEGMNTEDVRSFLQSRLPEHMVPSVYVQLEALPLSPVGKVDRHALPQPNAFISRQPKQSTGIADEFELKLTRIWQKVLNVEDICVDDNFFDLGGHSLLAVRLFAQIEKTFGRNLPLATLFSTPTIRQLTRAMREEGWEGSWDSLVVIQGNGDRRPFFCVHAAGGNVLEYHELAQLLGPDQPFYGLQAKGLDGKSEPLTTIKEMAAHYIKEMREIQPEGPYLIGGRSSGGTVAFEMACQLAAMGEQVDLLALIDTYPAGYFKLLPGAETATRRFGRSIKKLQTHSSNLRQLNLSQKLSYLATKLCYAPEKAKHKLYRRAFKIYQRIGKPLPSVLKNIEEINFAAVKDYEPQTYAGNITLFLASDLTADYDLREGWRELVSGRIEAHEIPGNHIDIIKKPHVDTLAQRLRECLDATQASCSRRIERAA